MESKFKQLPKPSKVAPTTRHSFLANRLLLMSTSSRVPHRQTYRTKRRMWNNECFTRGLANRHNRPKAPGSPFVERLTRTRCISRLRDSHRPRPAHRLTYSPDRCVPCGRLKTDLREITSIDRSSALHSPVNRTTRHRR
jgi:hypothetical protein